MDYIILDMEWDNAFFHKEKRFINQIIQIGAVKLNKDFNIVDTFNVIVRSSISKKLSSRFTDLVGITADMMRAGISLDDAINKYNEWAGNDKVTMTWSNSDLYSIIENERHLANGAHFDLGEYLDLQCYIQNEMRLMGFTITSQISLSNAAQILGIAVDDLALHNARDDSLIGARLLKKCYNEKRFNALVKDTTNPEFFGRLTFKSYYVSDINSDLVEKEQMKFCCGSCGGPAKRLTKWKFKNRYFTADFYCKNCDKRFNGRVSFKKTYDKVIVKKYLRDVLPKPKEVNKNDLQSVPSKM